MQGGSAKRSGLTLKLNVRRGSGSTTPHASVVHDLKDLRKLDKTTRRQLQKEVRLPNDSPISSVGSSADLGGQNVTPSAVDENPCAAAASPHGLPLQRKALKVSVRVVRRDQGSRRKFKEVEFGESSASEDDEVATRASGNRDGGGGRWDNDRGGGRNEREMDEYEDDDDDDDDDSDKADEDESYISYDQNEDEDDDDDDDDESEDEYRQRRRAEKMRSSQKSSASSGGKRKRTKKKGSGRNCTCTASRTDPNCVRGTYHCTCGQPDTYVPPMIECEGTNCHWRWFHPSCCAAAGQFVKSSEGESGTDSFFCNKCLRRRRKTKADKQGKDELSIPKHFPIRAGTAVEVRKMNGQWKSWFWAPAVVMRVQVSGLMQKLLLKFKQQSTAADARLGVEDGTSHEWVEQSTVKPETMESKSSSKGRRLESGIFGGGPDWVTVRPKPPPRPWSVSRKPIAGQSAEVLFDGGWWECTVVKFIRPPRGMSSSVDAAGCSVRFSATGNVVQIPCAHLRPRLNYEYGFSRRRYDGTYVETILEDEDDEDVDDDLSGGGFTDVRSSSSSSSASSGTSSAVETARRTPHWRWVDRSPSTEGPMEVIVLGAVGAGTEMASSATQSLLSTGEAPGAGGSDRVTAQPEINDEDEEFLSGDEDFGQALEVVPSAVPSSGTAPSASAATNLMAGGDLPATGAERAVAAGKAEIGKYMEDDSDYDDDLAHNDHSFSGDHDDDDDNETTDDMYSKRQKKMRSESKPSTYLRDMTSHQRGGIDAASVADRILARSSKVKAKKKGAKRVAKMGKGGGKAKKKKKAGAVFWQRLKKQASGGMALAPFRRK